MKSTVDQIRRRFDGGARVVCADVDLEDLPRTGQDATFKGICWYERREPAYGELSGEFLPDPFAK